MTDDRKDVSVVYNKWHDAQRVDQTDLEVEQNRNVATDAAIVHNHFGSGVLLENPLQPVIFDSDNLPADQAAIEAAGNFDGQGLAAHEQPSDINLGNQLEVELTGSDAIGRLSSKVAIIGLSFDDTLQMDRFYFYKNEKQVTANHYKRVLAVFFNDFKGNNFCSRNLGGRYTIKETLSFQLSRDATMVAQDVEPDIFWRDFKVSDPAVSLYNTIQNGIGPEYSVDALNINVTGQAAIELAANDVTTQVGQKFQATTDNIQKITMLLGARRDDTAALVDAFDWTGDMIISIYPLQSTVSCPTAIIPNLSIDFEPESTPLAQISFSQETLQEAGYILNEVAQPVDFVFNATKLGDGSTSNIVPGDYLAVTIKRSGASTSGTLFVENGTDRLDDSRLTIFSGVWVDVPENDLWFQVWTDAAQIADGQGYDEGNGIQFDKTTTDPETGASIDNQIVNKSFTDTGENILNVGVLQAISEESITVQDERTGNNINSRQQFVPSFNFVDLAGLTTLQQTANPLIIGCAEDTNSKQNALLTKEQDLVGLASGDQFCIVNPDPDLLSLNLIGSRLIPSIVCSETEYKIFKAELCVDGYGDVNGDGYIDAQDIAAVSALLGESLYYTATQQKIIDGYFSTLSLLRADVDGDGYVTSNDVDLITQYVNRAINAFPAGSSFTHMCLTVQQSTGRFDGYYDCDGYVRLDGYSGLNIVDPNSMDPLELLYDGYLVDPMIQSNPIFTTVPFVGVTYQIIHSPFWQPHFVVFSSDARIVPSAFINDDSTPQESCASTLTFQCADQNDIIPVCDPGRNDFYVPDNLIIDRGNVVRPDGTPVKADFEMGIVILQLPEEPLEEVSLNLFDKFVADRGDGITRGGFPAMRYFDCSTVQDEDLSQNRIRFDVSIQAFVPNLDGYDPVDGYGIIIDDIIGVHLDQTTGILKLSIKDLFADQVFKTLVTKIQIIAFLKKAGWNNQAVVVEPQELAGLLST